MTLPRSFIIGTILWIAALGFLVGRYAFPNDETGTEIQGTTIDELREGIDDLCQRFEDIGTPGPLCD